MKQTVKKGSANYRRRNCNNFLPILAISKNISLLPHIPIHLVNIMTSSQKKKDSICRKTLKKVKFAEKDCHAKIIEKLHPTGRPGANPIN